jgi:hypothetical protein
MPTFGVQYIMHTRRFYVVVALVVAGGCDSRNLDLPEVATPLGYDTVRVELARCSTPLPPVRDDSRCGASEIGKSIDVNDVCLLVRALKGWVESGRVEDASVHADDWPRVGAVCVARLKGPEISRLVWAPAARPQESPSNRSVLRLEADIPNRSQIVFVQMEYFVGPRTQPSTFIISDSGR